MSSKLCIALALGVLFGALAGGNPFLAAGPMPAAPSGSAGSFGAGTALAAAAQRPGAPRFATPAVAVSVGGTAQPAPPPCPEPALQPLVERVEFAGDGEAVWVLRDGRRVRRNPQPGDRQPAVLLVGAGPFGDSVDAAGR